MREMIWPTPAEAQDMDDNDPRRYSRPQDTADYATPTGFLVYDYATGATVLVPRTMYPMGATR